MSDSWVELLADDPMATGMRMVTGAVTDAAVWPPLIDIGGGAVATPCIGGYRPTTGDVVQVFTDWNGKFSASRICMGRLPRGHGCILLRSATQSMTGGASTAIQWDTETADPSGFITATDDDITIPTGAAAVYAVTASVNGAGSWAAGSSLIVDTGSFTYVAERARAGSALSLGFTRYLSAATSFTVNVYNNGATQNLTTARIDINAVA